MPTPPTARRVTTRQPARGLESLAALSGRLTERDRWLLRMLAEHQVLTTTQITALAFPSPRTATRRMGIMHELRAVERFRPLLVTGSAPLHFVLGETGARVVAEENTTTLTQLGYRTDRALAIAVSPRLRHTTGVNSLFTALATTPGGRLARWWSERRCAALWGDLARPDGYGRWHDHATGTITDFFTEYDTGSENLPRVVGKLAGYAALTDRTQITTPVLFWFPTPAREHAFRERLPSGGEMPVATASPTAGLPGAAVWLPAGYTGPRRRIGELRAVWPGLTPAGEEGGTGAGVLPWPAPTPIPPEPAQPFGGTS